MLEPPIQYDHPFEGELVIRTASWWRVPTDCGMPHVDACARRWWNTDTAGHGWWACFVEYPQLGTGGIDEEKLACLIRHETGHCNGWPGNHPNARFDQTWRQ